MRYLITGGAGFIGSHLAELLLREGHDVHVVDDLSTGDRANIAHLEHDPRFRCTIGSCADERIMTELIAASDAVFHLAASVGVRLIVERPVESIETNLHTTETVLAIAARHRTPVLLASSSEVYGKNDRIPFREDSELVIGATDRSRWSYACSKALLEFLALAYWKQHGQPVVIARLFNTVGPRQTGRYGMVVPTFVRAALGGRDLEVHGDGRQTRCFTHVHDVVRALACLMQSEAHHGQVFNVGSTHELSILDLAKQVREMTGSRSQLVFVPYERAYEPGFEDTARRVPDLAKIERAIGWRPTIEMPEILRDVIAASRP